MITRKIEAALASPTSSPSSSAPVAGALVSGRPSCQPPEQRSRAAPPLKRWHHERPGGLIEGVLTFFLVWVVFGTAVDPRGAFGRIAGSASIRRGDGPF